MHVKVSDFMIDHKKYIGTPGLWSLIMKRHPSAYSWEDLITYLDVILHTNVMMYPNNLEPTRRVTSTKRWREIFPIFDHHRGAEATTSLKQQHGNGVVQLLPGDIKGFETKLNYLLGEYRAGNRSFYTRNEIVSILDELLRRKRISRKEYQNINTFFKVKWW